ncbi:pyridoxamine 5'-phosphate oxidase family protein [Streptomyces deccanensis]|uniref:pyridoxamine 5'-phosphate oxidase family protein n=1 Tax=Streptomyces deccanensis TaxID=424188 RepID=UPI001EFC263F|nr:pyridoxamine 5'-phosphate oxidase family protein [Streptomyces deccanensis]ULR55549.1 pyridoxamine 5'-phosphate oxidase family protein [Streptomyces deccanensis]
MTRTPYHEGEQAVQRRAGEGHPGWGTPMFGDVIEPPFARFLERQQMLFLGGTDAEGAVWASVVTGDAGFVAPVDRHRLVIDAVPTPGDPLDDVYTTEQDIGIVAVDPHTARRIRLNGTARRHEDALHFRAGQVLGNCPKYIQRRVLVDSPGAPAGPAPAETRDSLTPEQQHRTARADTFFIASHSPDHGADVSHRGGTPGFVTAGPRRLSWPDYVGNSFYMTLGNIHLNPACGLLFLDWEQGHTLQLTGTARVDWDPGRAAALPGALRFVDFDIERVVEIPHATPLRWALAASSPFNPPLTRSRPPL